MLKFFVVIIAFLTVFAFLSGITLSCVKKSNNKIAYITISSISFIGIVSNIIMIFLKLKFPQKMVKYSLFYNRRSLALGMFFLFISLIISIIILIKKEKNKFFYNLYIFFSSLSIWFVGFTILPQVYFLSREFIAFGETSFGTQSFIRMSGYILAIISIILISLSINKVANKLNEKFHNYFIFLITTISFLDFFLRGISALARMRFLKSSNKFVFKIMIFEDKSTPYIIGALVFIAFVFSIKLFKDSIKITGTFKNNAMRRIQKAKFQNNRRWAYSLYLFSLISLLSVTIISYYIYKPVELSPPRPYQTEGNFIVIPLDDIDDGHLHRFSYISKEGNNVRFIAVKKIKGGSYGLGLDACDICGIAGYYERNDDVICKRCDVVMNKATIGFRGGCNPIPFDYEIKNSKIYIDMEVLEKEKDRFPVGE